MESEAAPSDPGVSSGSLAPERRARPKRPAHATRPKPKPPWISPKEKLLQKKSAEEEVTAEPKREAESEEEEASPAEEVDEPNS